MGVIYIMPVCDNRAIRAGHMNVGRLPTNGRGNHYKRRRNSMGHKCDCTTNDDRVFREIGLKVAESSAEGGS